MFGQIHGGVVAVEHGQLAEAWRFRCLRDRRKMQQDGALKIAFSALLALRWVNRLTGSWVGIDIVEVSGPSNGAAPVHDSTVRTNRELLIRW